MKVVIMAGGKGTRIASLDESIPKPLIKINNIPVLEREILLIKKQGFKDFVITISHLGNVIKDYFGNGKNFGVNIDYYFEEIPLGNAGALFKISDKLSDDFLLLNADLVFDIDFNRLVKYHYQKGGLATILTHPNSHPYDSSLIVADSNNLVIGWISKEDDRTKYYKNRVNAGIHILNKKILNIQINKDKIDLDRDILKPLVNKKCVYCYDSSEYIKDMGTVERFEKVSNDVKKNICYQKNLLNKQRAIFLDRDGTINKYVGFLRNIKNFELLPNVTDAIKKINDSLFLAIIITNQPIIARGEVSIDELNNIHNYMETLLGKAGAYINGLYYCPHHPDKGFIGEKIEYKIKCNCRKPHPGLILKAKKDFNIDLSKSWMIGDSKEDVLCGKNAGCKTIFLSCSKENPFNADYVCNNLLDAINKILGD